MTRVNSFNMSNDPSDYVFVQGVGVTHLSSDPADPRSKIKASFRRAMAEPQELAIMLVEGMTISAHHTHGPDGGCQDGTETGVMALVTSADALATLAANISEVVGTWSPEDQARYRHVYDQMIMTVREHVL